MTSANALKRREAVTAHVTSKLFPLPEQNASQEKSLALSTAEAKLSEAERQIDALQQSNARLTCALAEASQRGTEANHLAHHDNLTGLPNRLLLAKRLQREIAEAEQQRQQLALLFIDLDNFKVVNDCLGHFVGDVLLQSVASRIRACIRADDIAFRYGGDEFVVLLSDIANEAIANQAAQEIRERIEGRYGIEGKDVHIRASIGLARYPADADHCEALLKCADASMYRNKSTRTSSRAIP